MARKKHISTTVLEEILLDLNHHLAILAWLKKKFITPFYGCGSATSRLVPFRGGSLEYLFFSKKVTRTITQNLAEVGLFLTYSFSFAYSYTFCLK